MREAASLSLALRLTRAWRLSADDTKRQFHNHPSLVSQLDGYGAPKPTPTSNDVPLIDGHMRTFPTMHPSLGSVANQTATGCPAIVFNQMSSDMWKSTTAAELWEKNPTLPKRKEGKATPSALRNAADLYVVPIETYVPPPNAPTTIYRDQRVFKHMGTLSRQGHRW